MRQSVCGAQAEKCSAECGLASHADCVHLVPDFCGMSMEMARQLIGDIRNINKTRSALGPTAGRLGGSSSVPPSPTARFPPGQQQQQIDGGLADSAGRMQIDPYKRIPAPAMQAPPPGRNQQQQMPPQQYQQQVPQPFQQPMQQGPPQGMPQYGLQQQMQDQGRYQQQGPPQLPMPAGLPQQQADQRPQGPRQTPSGPVSGGRPPVDPRNPYPLPIAASQMQQRQQYPLPSVSAPQSFQQAPMSGGGVAQELRQSTQQRPPQQQPTGPGGFATPDGQVQSGRPMSGVQQMPQQTQQPGPQGDQRFSQQQQAEQRPSPNQRMSFNQQQGAFPQPSQGQQQQQQGPPPQQQQQQQQQQQSPVKARPQSVAARKIGLDDFNFLAVLGKGNFGKVMLAEERRSNKLWAIKVLKKEFIIENDEVESTKSEKRVFLAAARERHPFLLDLHSCFQTETRIYFVMEYVSGGDLMLHIQREQFTPRRARFYAAEVLLALEYFHKQGIVYRDLKLDNILLTLDGHVKVADYGLCKENMWYQQTTSTFCGTPEFMAPEILLDKRYGRAVDWWAFGVLIYEMLLGQSPFRGDDEDEIFDAILEDEPLYPIHMPRASVSILQQLLCRDVEHRLGAGPNDADDIKAHVFFRGINWDDIFHKRVPAPYFPTINGPLDTSNFDQEFTREQPTLTPVHSQLSAADQKEFASFSWVGPAALAP